jgi:hypothetical protein
VDVRLKHGQWRGVSLFKIARFEVDVNQKTLPPVTPTYSPQIDFFSYPISFLTPAPPKAHEEQKIRVLTVYMIFFPNDMNRDFNDFLPLHVSPIDNAGIHYPPIGKMVFLPSVSIN